MIDIYKTFYPNAAKYTLFSSAPGTFSGIDHMLGHKTSLNKFRKIKIISSIFSNQNGVKLEINYKKKARNITNMWQLGNMLLNNYWVNKDIKGEMKKN